MLRSKRTGTGRSEARHLWAADITSTRSASVRTSSLRFWALASCGAVALTVPPALQGQALRADHLAALEFRTIGPAAMSGRVVDLAVVERDVDVFYVATATGGVWKTENRAMTLVPVFEKEGVHSVGAIAVHQADTNVVWVGTGERASRQSSSWGDGVYKSVDGGTTWRNMGLRESLHIGRIVLHPTDPNVVFVAAMGHLWGPNEERGLYRSVDGGERWTRVLAVDANTGAVDVAMDPADPSILYAATYQRRRRPWGFHGGGPGSGLWKSTDGGSTWSALTNSGIANGLPEGDLGRIGISVYRSDPRIVYVSIEQGERYNASTAYEQREAGVYRSEDRGATWTHMGDWNPRPMYASQILVDPLDDQRVYMVNAYSFSDDGGETFTVPPQSLHGDDRLVWVNPQNSNHVMKADDGGLGISYDRGLTWVYISDLPVSQYYRVSYDLRDPYWIYGGLQDNGSWGGPNATFRSEGVLNSDWIRYGGGDGFLNLVDTTDNRTLYTESQYLGLSRVDLVTGERTTIRPGDSIGAIAARRNWTTWPDLSDPYQRLGNAMAPANWDGPFLLSPHDLNTIYAGTNVLWRSPDRGQTWEALGDLTSGTDRRTLDIMEELPDSFTLSLDDGIPYWPTLTAIAESPVREGVLYVGTDDGKVWVSQNRGADFEDMTDGLSGLPPLAWINDIEVSRHVTGRVFVSANNYRNDDYANYLFRSDDFGRTWTSITGDLPPDRVVRVVREDLSNPAVLYLGTELGLFVSTDDGRHWVSLGGNLPTVAVNDIRIHPRERDLIIGTHGRGIWILDQITALSGLTSETRTRSAYVFEILPARQIRYRPERPHTGDVFYRGENPPRGAVVDFWLSEPHDSLTLTFLNESGTEVARMETTGAHGLNRVVWNLRHSEPDQVEDRDEDSEADRGSVQPTGPLVVPGRYTARLGLSTETVETRFLVLEDPRITADDATRAAWTARLLEISETVRAAAQLAREVRRASEADEEAGIDNAAVRKLSRESGELAGRLRRLRREAEGSVAPLTADQASELAYYRLTLDQLREEWDALGNAVRR